MRHSEVKQLLYDYACHQLSAHDLEQVSRHIEACHSCTTDAARIKETLSALSLPTTLPSDERNVTFWNMLSSKVEAEIHGTTRKPIPFSGSVSEFVRRFRLSLSLNPGYAFAAVGSAFVVTLAAVLFNPFHRQEAVVAERVAPATASPYISARDDNRRRIGQYFQRSKTLLVGLANMKTDDDQPVDLRAERKVSRNLIHEARYLQRQPLDDHSARLVQDLEKILIELANLEEDNDLTNVELIRSGIHQENLLFKIRMAEASYKTK